MEVLAHSALLKVDESDRSPESKLVEVLCDKESTSVEHGKQAAVDDKKLHHFVPDQNLAPERMNVDVETAHELCSPRDHDNISSHCDLDVDSGNPSVDFHGFEDDKIDPENPYEEPGVTFANSVVVVDTIESELSSEKKDDDLCPSDLKLPDRDESMALWVKWRGKWQTGIRCERADWPLATVKAKPTHDRKNYVVIFSPNTRNYSWVDTSLVCSIDKVPEPIVHRSHKVGVQLVNDLTLARRFIMQKLAVGMLNIIDQLPLQMLIETARNVTAWKEFAMEASRCEGYPDLGRMLLRLQKMLLEQYVDADWLKLSFNSWVERCQNAPSAESVELLKEELEGSILWDEVTFVRDAEGQPAVASEWKTWKHEVLKWFSTSHSVPTGGDLDQRDKSLDLHYNSPLAGDLQISRKRPKLEIRRAEPHSTLVENRSSYNDAILEIDSGFFVGRIGVAFDGMASPSSKGEHLIGVVTPQSPTASVADRWDEIMVDNSNTEFNHGTVVEAEPINMRLPDAKSMHPGHRSRQCRAFIEAKGRQCVRWANDGDVYCCVHLASRFAGSSSKGEGTPSIEDSQMCEGTTVLGTKCKHHALQGSSYCKKHGPRDDVTKNSSPGYRLKRKLEEHVSLLEGPYPKDNVMTGRTMEEERCCKGNSSFKTLENASEVCNNAEKPQCIGLGPQVSSLRCLESPKWHSLYCEKHIPNWLKRARNGKSRIISKEVFVNLLAGCPTWEHKVYLHQACEIFYKLFKSILSLRNQVPREIQFQWALSEASKNSQVAEYLTRLVSSEKERINRIWGFGLIQKTFFSSTTGEQSTVAAEEDNDDDGTIKCKFCSIKFSDDHALGNHWINSHNKEAQWLFRGYACAICLDSFTNRKVLESHVQERHHAQFVEHCMLFQCIPCGSHFGNSEELWAHVLSAHSDGFRQLKAGGRRSYSVSEDSMQKPAPENVVTVENNSEGQSTVKRYICRFCGLRFDLLPDLGRHHQAAHMAPNLGSGRPSKKGLRFYAYRLKSGRLSRPRFKKGLGGGSFRLKSKVTASSLKKRILASSASSARVMNVPSRITPTEGLSGLTDVQCLEIAKILCSEAQKTIVHPSNNDILSAARSSCCRVSLEALFEEKYGVLPERLCLKAAKLCSEHNIQIGWHQEGFSCWKGCKSMKEQNKLPLLTFPSKKYVNNRISPLSDCQGEKWEMDECHYVIDSHHFRNRPSVPTIILCDDISNGMESVPIACLIDKKLIDSLHIPTFGFDGRITFMPWESFNYVIKPLLGQSFQVDFPSLHLGCGCAESTCCPETCDHVYLFDNDFEDAKDIFGKPMRGRLFYDDDGRILLEEGYPVYECNYMCKCSEDCSNRILQNGMQVKLELIKTEKKGWAVRAGEEILRGTFICELIGEVLDEAEANIRRKSYGSEGCNYLFDVRSLMNDMNNLLEGPVPCVIDATRYGNVSRFINHSCSPCLVSRVVLVDSMETQLVHIGLYANRDIASGEELTFDYLQDLESGHGCPCLCGASTCRGQLHCVLSM